MTGTGTGPAACVCECVGDNWTWPLQYWICRTGRVQLHIWTILELHNPRRRRIKILLRRILPGITSTESFYDYYTVFLYVSVNV